MAEEDLRVDLFEVPVEIIKIEKRKQTNDYMVQMEYEQPEGDKPQTVNLYMSVIPTGLNVGDGFALCLEARS